MNAAIDPIRLYTILDKTNTRSKDPVLYQLLYNLIGNIVNLKTNTSGGGGGGGSTTINNITNLLQQLILNEGSGDELTILQQITQGGSGPSTDTYAIPVTNGDPLMPECVFDSTGDIVYVVVTA